MQRSSWGPDGQKVRGSEKGWRMRCQEKDRMTLPPSQQEPSQEELTAEDHRDPPVSRRGCCVQDASMGKCVWSGGFWLAVPVVCEMCALGCSVHGDSHVH